MSASADKSVRVWNALNGTCQQEYWGHEDCVYSVHYGFCLHEGQYLPLPPDTAGVLESPWFPGLRLHVSALLARDRGTVLAELQRGLASPAHAALIARLQNPSCIPPFPRFQTLCWASQAQSNLRR